MLYNYLVTIYKVIVGLVTPERLMGVALGAFGVYVIWMTISLLASFQRKFNSRCQELVNFTIRTKDIEKNPELLDKMADKISSGFGYGWKKFRNSEVGKPSDFITRREALDVEVNGGILNNGKTMMRAFISFITVLLAIFNLVYVGGEKSLTFMIFAEALFLPLIFYIVVKLFYFLHSSIKQKLYKMSIESFYEVIDLLDAKFVKKGRFVAIEGEETLEENEEEKTEEEGLEENEEEKGEEEPEEEVDSLDKYDIFKKKNIDIDLDKLLSETPKSDATLPFINVDSDYVIKDDEQVGAKRVEQDDNMSTLFGGMLQNTSGMKKGNFVDVKKDVAEIDGEKLEKLSLAEEMNEAANKVLEDLNSESKEEVKEEAKEETETSEKKEEEKEDPIIDIPVAHQEPQEKKFSMEVNLNTEPKPVIKTEPETESSDLSPNSNKFIEIEKNEKDDLALQEENIANVVSGFKASRSKLASGGMVIERNEPISRRERASYYADSTPEPAPVVQQSQRPVEQPVVKNDITIPVAEDNADSVLNALKSAPGTYDAGYVGSQTFAPSTNYGVGYDQGYGYNTQPMYQPQPQMQGYGYNQPAYSNYNQSGYGMGMQDMQSNQDYEEYYADEEDVVEEEVVEEAQPKKKKTVRTKENEPRPRNLKSSSKKSVKEEPKEVERRGRPKKQEVSESMVIENDKQFNEVLARAEKLMRKGEEGLSESQTKRIEKEIKILMDAMNRYKESK